MSDYPKYMVISYVDFEFEYANSWKEAQRYANEFENSIIEHADYAGEFLHGSRVDILEIKEIRDTVYHEYEDYFTFETVKESD